MVRIKDAREEKLLKFKIRISYLRLSGYDKCTN